MGKIAMGDGPDYGDGSGDGSGYGCGSGFGKGCGYGSGYGSGDGSGYGCGLGSGYGAGYGAVYGDVYGFGYDNGSGFGDGFGDAGSTTLACTVPPGYAENDDDCDDTDPAINPDATEICNGVDDDCDGSIDEDEVCYCDVAGGGGNYSLGIPDGYVNYLDVAYVRGKIGGDPCDEGHCDLDLDSSGTLTSDEYKAWLNECYITQ